MKHVIYECEICGGAHPWEWDGECRDNATRYADEDDYAKRNGVDVGHVEVRTMTERVAADVGFDFDQQAWDDQLRSENSPEVSK